MRTSIMLGTLGLGLALVAAPVHAGSCPVLIKQGQTAAGQMNQNDPKVKQALDRLAEAQALHDVGKHKQSLDAANAALELLGIKK